MKESRFPGKQGFDQTPGSGLRVLMVSRRDDEEVPGGDTIQLQETRRALISLGLEASYGTLNSLDDGHSEFDLVHLFNIQNAVESSAIAQRVCDEGLPLVVSPIFWEPYSNWFAHSANRTMTWRLLRQLLGRESSYRIYEFWQRAKANNTMEWRLQRQTLRQADLLLPNSETEASHLMRTFKLPANDRRKMVAVPNAVDPSFFEEIPASFSELPPDVSNQEFVLQVGRLSPEKNPLGLIRALWKEEMRLVFVGSPSPYHAEYAEKCYSAGNARGNVMFFDWQPQEDLKAFYSRARVHALPSFRETPGLASLEAAAVGCHIVSTSVGSAYEYFGEDAWYCDPGSLASIRSAVLSALRAQPNGHLRRHVQSSFTWKAAAKRTLLGYREALARRHNPSMPNRSGNVPLIDNARTQDFIS